MQAPTNTQLTLIAQLGQGQTGKTIGYTIHAGDGSTFQDRTTAGVAEIAAGSGSYRVQLPDSTFPAAFDGYVLWDVNGGSPYAGEDITITNSGGDPWETELPGIYTGDEAGAILAAVKAKTDLLTTATSITLVAPVLVSGAIAVVQGDDYKANDGRSLQWSSTSWPDLTGAAISFIPSNGVTKDGAVLSSSSARVELTSTETAALDVGRQTYALKATLANNDIVTLATGTLVVSDQPREHQ